MNTKNVLASIVISVVVVFLGFSVFGGKTEIIREIKDKTFGAVSTLDAVDNPFVKVNGMQFWAGTVPTTATSSIICAIKNPYNATSTIVASSVEQTERGNSTWSWTAHNLYMSTSTLYAGLASSTPALVAAFPMGTGQFSVNFQPNSATSTSVTDTNQPSDKDVLPGRTAAGKSNYILGPSEYLTWRIATSTVTTLDTYPTGTCTAVFRKI